MENLHLGNGDAPGKEQDTNGKPKRSGWEITIIIVSIVNIVIAGLTTIITAPYPVGVGEDISEFVILALILGMSIASLVIVRDKSKAGFILVFGIVILLLPFAPHIIPVTSPPSLIFGIQGILYIVATVQRKTVARTTTACLERLNRLHLP